MVKKEVEGTPVPLKCLTPDLLFYPLKLPTGCVWFFVNKHINSIKKENKINLNEKEHLIFVDALMKSLNINYQIIGPFLVDLTRKEFKLKIDHHQNINISEYKLINRITCLTEKSFKIIEKITQDINKRDYDNVNHDNKIMNYIKYHCNRISFNTNVIEKIVEDNFEKIIEDNLNKNYYNYHCYY